MATRYVRKSGSDSNGGTSSSDAWLTIGKALSTVSSGDLTYIGAGTYRENLVPPNSFTSQTRFVGDIDGAQTGDAGDVIVSSYLTSDTSAPSSGFTVNIAKNFINLERLIVIGGNVNPVCTVGGVGHDIQFIECTFIASGTPLSAVVSWSATANVQGNFLMDRCVVVSPSSNDAIRFTIPTSATADYTINAIVKNCFVLSFASTGIQIVPSGALTFKGGGVRIDNCTILGANAAGVWANGTAATLSTTYPTEVYGCLLYGSPLALRANAAGILIEDYNILAVSNTPRTNVTAGSHSISNNSYAVLVETFQSYVTGRQPRPFFTPMTGSPLLGFDAHAGGPSVDMLNRPRPLGGASAVNAVGALERANTWTKETSTVRTGSTALVCTGPGIQEFELPVDALATSVTVWMRFDSTYSGTKPSLSVTNGSEAGVADATATMVGAANTWEQLSLSFTPSRSGVVTIRLTSASTAGSGKAFADDVGVT